VEILHLQVSVLSLIVHPLDCMFSNNLSFLDCIFSKIDLVICGLCVFLDNLVICGHRDAFSFFRCRSTFF